MILLTRLNGVQFALNPDLFERAESTPDTVVMLVDGTRYVVSERLDQVIDRVREWRASVVAVAHAPLTLVPADDTLDTDQPYPAPVPLHGPRS